jgi:hypothetical protein
MEGLSLRTQRRVESGQARRNDRLRRGVQVGHSRVTLVVVLANICLLFGW